MRGTSNAANDALSRTKNEAYLQTQRSDNANPNDCRPPVKSELKEVKVRPARSIMNETADGGLDDQI